MVAVKPGTPRRVSPAEPAIQTATNYGCLLLILFAAGGFVASRKFRVFDRVSTLTFGGGTILAREVIVSSLTPALSIHSEICNDYLSSLFPCD